MRLAILYTKEKEYILTRLKEFFDAHLIQTQYYEMYEDENVYFFDKINKLLDESDSLFIIGSEKVYSSPWLLFLLGALRLRKDDIFFYLEQESSPEFPEWLQEYRNSINLVDISHYYLERTEMWDMKIKKEIAIRKLGEHNIEVSSFRFIQAILMGDRFVTGLFLDAGYSASMKDENGVPVVCHASREGHLKILSALLSAGAELDVIAEDRGNTALMDAASNGDLGIVEHLIQNGADIEVVSKNGQTALILATGNGKVEVASYLISKGADYNRKDVLGMSAKKYCELYNHTTLLALIEKFENDSK